MVEAHTRVVYQQQYDGTACRQGQVEGFLVPVYGSDAEEPHDLQLDESRIHDIDEAWVPVVTPRRFRGVVVGQLGLSG